LACAAALASLDIFEKDRTLEYLAPKIARLSERLERLTANPHVGDGRQCGFIAGIEVVDEKATGEAVPYRLQRRARICPAADERGCILRPLADTIVVMPPLIISMENLDMLMDAIEWCIDQVAPDAQAGSSDGLE